MKTFALALLLLLLMSPFAASAPKPLPTATPAPSSPKPIVYPSSPALTNRLKRPKIQRLFVVPRSAYELPSDASNFAPNRAVVGRGCASGRCAR